jgi:hypothetical protein
VRYWKGTYDEDSQRDLDLRLARRVPKDDSDLNDLWLFRALVAFQIALVSLVVLLYVDWQ